LVVEEVADLVRLVKMEAVVAAVFTEAHQVQELALLDKALLAVLSDSTVGLAREPLQALAAVEQEEWVSAEPLLAEALEVLARTARLLETFSAAEEEVQLKVSAARPFSQALEDEAEEAEATRIPSLSAEPLLLERPTLAEEEEATEATEAPGSSFSRGSPRILATTITSALLVTCVSTIAHLVKPRLSRLLNLLSFRLQTTLRLLQRSAPCPTRGPAQQASGGRHKAWLRT